jgi:hypothetical protein
MLGSNGFDETHEVGGSARTEKHFVELQQALRLFGFEVNTDVDGMIALHKRPDGTLIGRGDRA